MVKGAPDDGEESHPSRIFRDADAPECQSVSEHIYRVSRGENGNAALQYSSGRSVNSWSTAIPGDVGATVEVSSAENIAVQVVLSSLTEAT